MAEGIPILGGQKLRGATGFGGIVRKLDENGTYEITRVVQGPEGPVGVAGRDAFMDAEEFAALVAGLVRATIREDVREIVREELSKATLEVMEEEHRG